MASNQGAVQHPSPTRGISVILYGGMFRSFQGVNVMAHGNGDVIFAVIRINAPTQE